PSPPAAGTSPHAKWPQTSGKSAPAAPSIHDLSVYTFVSKTLLAGWRIFVTTELIAATAPPTRRGPPESPVQMFESVPGGPTGSAKSQHTWLVSLISGTPGTRSTHVAVSTWPDRLSPIPSPKVPGAGGAVWPKP